MLQFKEFIENIDSIEEARLPKEGQRSLHWKLGKGKRGKARPPHVRRKISRSMAGKSNFEGETHTTKSKQKIADSRGHDDRVDGRHWIKSKTSSKTYRRYTKPDNYRWGR